MAYIGEKTIGILPPSISDQVITPDPNPYEPAMLANKGTSGVTNTTFKLNTNTTTPAGENKVMRLHQQTYANAAIIVVEAVPGTTPNKIIARFWQDGSFPTPTDGLPLKDCSIFEIIGTNNIRNFRIITADDAAHTVQVQYLM